MTDHAEISRRLALAIGWPEKAITVTHGQCFIWLGRDGRGFDYRDPAVIWPIAERYNCFPYKTIDSGKWFSGSELARGDTAAEAVARAVIGSNKG